MKAKFAWISQYGEQLVLPIVPLISFLRVLAEIYMRDHNMSQTDLAEKIGCAHRKINEIVNGKRSITPEFALELEKVFKAPADMWVRIQAEYDLWVVREKRKHAPKAT